MIKVFIGTDSSIHQKAEKVVKYSILKNTTHDVDVQFIHPEWRSPGPTGFTLHRYLIPELCNYEGYAIYLDVDMLVLGDIKELWDYQTPGKWCTTKWASKQTNDDVSVVDCSSFRDLPKGIKLRSFRKEKIREQIGNRYLQNIPNEWNHRGEPTPNTKLIHYTHLKSQPWKPSPRISYIEHPHKNAANLFFQYLTEAEENGF